MASETIITLEIIAKAESMREGVCAGIARLTDVLQAPSYKAAHDQIGRDTLFGQDGQVEWPADAATALLSAKDRKLPALKDFASPFSYDERS